jgi:hypothetical protein
MNQTLQNFSRLKICMYNQTAYAITTNCHYLKDQSNIYIRKIGKFWNIYVSPYHNMFFTILHFVDRASCNDSRWMTNVTQTSFLCIYFYIEKNCASRWSFTKNHDFHIFWNHHVGQPLTSSAPQRLHCVNMKFTVISTDLWNEVHCKWDELKKQGKNIVVRSKLSVVPQLVSIWINTQNRISKRNPCYKKTDNNLWQIWFSLGYSQSSSSAYN